MRRLWRSTFGLVALVAGGLAVATFLVGLVAFELMHEALEVQLDHRIAVETRALIHEGAEGRAGVAAAIRRREAATTTASLGYLLVDRFGRRIAGALDANAPADLGNLEFLHYREAGERRIAQALTTRLADGAKLVVAADRGVIDEMDATLLKLFAAAFGVMLLLGAAGAWVVGAVTRSRLARIDHTALAIIDGDLTRRVPLAGSGDEFDRVSATLNRMLDRIGALMDNLRQVSSDVAHDLRTPLTRLHNRLDEAVGADDPQAQRRAIDAATRQARDLLDIFSALLRIAEVEGMTPRAQFRPVNLSLLVEELVETYRPDMEAAGHVLGATIAPGVSVLGDRRLLQQMLTNLLDNVLRHTPSGTKVDMDLTQSGGHIALSIVDDGPGVAPADRGRLFQRFARAEPSRTTEGHGLGLALVAAVAATHRGLATLLPGAGFRVEIKLPVGSVLA
jgi:signal transduction histidine kinase